MKTLLINRSQAAAGLVKACSLALLLCACSDQGIGPRSSYLTPESSGAAAQNSWGPESPNFNLEVVLRGENGAFGLVKFRQPNDDLLVIKLDTWIRSMEPNTSYILQRAVDTNLDGNCTGTAWLTLGKGLVPQAIVTDERGFGSEELFRSVAAFPVGSTFDIHFRVLKEATMEVVLTSDCYRFTISQ